jgi:hypothetical protein
MIFPNMERNGKELMTMAPPPYNLPRFTEAMKAYAKELSIGTYWRYTNGLLPGFGVLLVERPELAQALAEDALDLATRPLETNEERPAQ